MITEAVKQELFAKVDPHLRRYVGKFGTRHYEENLQDSRVEVWKSLDRFDPDHPNANVIPYCLVATKRCILEKIRYAKRREEIHPISLDMVIDAEGSRLIDFLVAPETYNPLKDLFDELLPKLTAPEERYIRQMYLEGFTLKEVSEEDPDKRNEAAIYSMKNRGLKKLHRMIYNMAGKPERRYESSRDINTVLSSVL